VTFIAEVGRSLVSKLASVLAPLPSFGKNPGGGGACMYKKSYFSCELFITTIMVLDTNLHVDVNLFTNINGVMDIDDMRMS
jgi:hypothetical protein